MTSSADAAVWRVPVVHAIATDDKLLSPDFLRRATEVIAALGARGAVHVRARGLSDQRLFDLAAELVEVAAATGCTIVVNDRIDVALAARARAIQLGSRSVEINDVRELAPSLRLGRSVHSAAEARDAGLFGADWCLAGHVFDSPTHGDEPGRGLAFARACAGATEVPVIAIGGVTPARIRELVEAGLRGVASVSGIWDAPNPGEAAARYLSEYVAAERRE